MMLLYFSLQLAQATCSEPTSLESFSQHLDLILASFSKRDLPELEKYYQQHIEDLPCLEEVISPEEAHRHHMLTGLYLWVQKEEELALQSFATSKQLHPESQISEYLFLEEGRWKIH